MSLQSLFFCWAQKVNKLGPSGCQSARTLLTVQGTEVVKHFLSWTYSWCEGVTDSSPLLPCECQALVRACHSFLGACLTLNNRRVSDSLVFGHSQ